jgi:hypothetical protein
VDDENPLDMNAGFCDDDTTLRRLRARLFIYELYNNIPELKEQIKEMRDFSFL